MAQQRKRVLDRTVTIDCADLFDGKTLDEVRLELTAMADKYEREFITLGHDAKFSVDYYGYDGGFDLELQVWRDENDKEYNARLERERQASEKKKLAKERQKEKARKQLMESEAAERAEYERLKAKFGPWDPVNSDPLDGPMIKMFRDD